MGKCSIISHDGDGLYTIQMLPDFSLIESDILRLTAQLSDIDNVELVNLELAYLLKESETDAAKATADALISTYAGDPTPENLAAVNEGIAAVGAAIIQESEAKIPYDAVKVRKLAIEKRLLRLADAIETPPTTQAWCADLSDGLKARSLYSTDDVVGTIELVGDGDNGISLQPHYDELGLYLDTRDGYLTPTASLTPASYYYNRAMLPGWQKWDAIYRPGVIVSAAGGSFEVQLDAVASGEQYSRIPVNDLDDGANLTGLNAEYMNCNNAAFTVDDHVIVKSTYDGSRVRTDVIVGFVDNPQPCDVSGFNYHPNVVGGPSPGMKDWQNIQSNGAGGWAMRSPILTDLISDGAQDVVDWKGYLSGGEKILVQWVFEGPSIYVDTIKTAVLPTFTLTPAAGDTSGSLAPDGFDAAWITSDNQYLYAIPRESTLSRHVLRKTTTVELTGAAYNATTDPHGWEVSSAFGQASGGYFQRFGIPKVNQSGTEARSMDVWTHGAKRSPQVSPGVGATWRSSASYDPEWLEESQLTISTPSASSISGAGISYQFNGVVGGYLYTEKREYRYAYRAGSTTCGIFEDYATAKDTSLITSTYSGSYAVGVGYQNDVLGYLNINGAGVYSQEVIQDTTNVCDAGTPSNTYTETRSGTTTAGGAGFLYSSDFESWSLPFDVLIITTDTISGAGAFCSDWVYNQVQLFDQMTGEMPYYDVTNSIYRNIAYKRTFDDSIILSNDPACEGIGNTTTTVVQEGTVELGSTELNHAKTISEVVVVTDPYVYIFPFFIGVAGETYDAGNDPQILLNTDVTTLYNDTALADTVRYGVPVDSFGLSFYARDFDDNFIASYTHTYNATAATEYEDFLTGGDLSTLDELDNGTGTQYLDTHVAN